MSKGISSSKTDYSSKRAKKHDFGAPIPEDTNPLKSQLTAPSSTSYSVRMLPPTETPSLVTLCIRTFVTNYPNLLDKRKASMAQYWLRSLPEAIIPKLFAELSITHPSLLSNTMILNYFLRGDPIILLGSIPAISSSTIQALARTNKSLRECRLTDLDQVPDNVFASLFSQLPLCDTLVLKGSTKVGKTSMEAVANTCKRLRKLNLNFTSATSHSIAHLTNECLELEVLKLAGIQSINDNTLAEILHISRNDNEPLRRLTHLKLKHTLITEQSMKRIISRCIHLKRLDVSFTYIKQPAFLFGSDALELEKLSLTFTPLTSAFLLKVATPTSWPPLRFLRTLYIGAMGSSPSSQVRSAPDALTLNDMGLDLLTDGLYECKYLENISLAGNSKLGFRSKTNSALARFIRMVGRRCKILNLAAIPRLKSSDLSDLPSVEASSGNVKNHSTDYDPPPIHTLNLNGTDINDDAATYIAACPNLRTLSIASTKMNYEPLVYIIDACAQLTTLDLTSCRNLKVADRRRFFEVWQEHRRINL